MQMDAAGEVGERAGVGTAVQELLHVVTARRPHGPVSCPYTGWSTITSSTEQPWSTMAFSSASIPGPS